MLPFIDNDKISVSASGVMVQLAKGAQSLSNIAAQSQETITPELTQHLAVLCHVICSQPQLTSFPLPAYKVCIWAPAMQLNSEKCTVF